MSKQEEKVKALLQEWAELQAEYWERTAGLREEIAELQEQELQVKEAYLPEFERLSAEIAAQMKELQKTVKLDEVGYASWRSGYVRYTWDSRGLEAYAGKHPAVMQFRKATQVDPQVKVKIYE